jgi:uncharacterized protein (UPF0332 family)
LNEIQAFLEKAERALRSAEDELGKENLDFAASRAYYASFYIAQALLLTKGFSFSSHGQAIAQYGLLFARDEKLDRRFHQLLIRAFRLRQAGDYEALFEAEPQLVLELIQEGQDFLETATRYLQALSESVEGGEA